MNNFPRINGSRVVLKAMEIGDAVKLYEAVMESYDHLHAKFIWATPNYSKKSSEDRIWQAYDNVDLGKAYDFGIFINDVLIGCASITYKDKCYKTVGIGCWIRDTYSNRGLATEVDSLLVEFGFRVLKVNRIEITVSPENIAGQKIAEKLGAKKEGLLRKWFNINGQYKDAIIYSIIEEDRNEV